MMAPQTNTAARQHARRREDLVVRASEVEHQNVDVRVVGLVPFHKQAASHEVREGRPFESREVDVQSFEERGRVARVPLRVRADQDRPFFCT